MIPFLPLLWIILIVVKLLVPTALSWLMVLVLPLIFIGAGVILFTIWMVFATLLIAVFMR